jgi:hypothetical protein
LYGSFRITSRIKYMINIGIDIDGENILKYLEETVFYIINK